MPLQNLFRDLAEYDAALLANTIGYIDPTPAEEIYMSRQIQCQPPAKGPMVGIAVTCEMDSSTPGGEPDFEAFYGLLEEIQRVGAAAVWVVKTVGSRPDHECVLGDGTAKELYSAGCIGAVTDGGVRDVAGYASVPFHAFAQGRTIHHTALRFRHVNQPVAIGGLTIRTGLPGTAPGARGEDAGVRARGGHGFQAVRHSGPGEGRPGVCLARELWVYQAGQVRRPSGGGERHR